MLKYYYWDKCWISRPWCGLILNAFCHVALGPALNLLCSVHIPLFGSPLLEAFSFSSLIKITYAGSNCCPCRIFLHKFSWRRWFACYYFFVRNGSISFTKWLYPIFQVGLSSAELKLNIDFCRTLVLGNPCWICTQEKGVVAKMITLRHPLPNWSWSDCGEWS